MILKCLVGFVILLEPETTNWKSSWVQLIRTHQQVVEKGLPDNWPENFYTQRRTWLYTHVSLFWYMKACTEQVWHGSISFHAWWAHPQGRCVHSLVSALNPSKTRSESSSYTTQETPATLSYKGKTCLTKSSLKKIEVQLKKQKKIWKTIYSMC